MKQFIRRKIRKDQQQLGHGHDIEIYLTLARRYHELGEVTLALDAYRAAVKNLTSRGEELDTANSNHLIFIYRQMLILSPLNSDITAQLGREYQRRGMEYRAIALHTTLAEQYTQRGQYKEAIEQYCRVTAIEPNSITARQICAYLYCHLCDYQHGAQEYLRIGDIFFHHHKWEGALEYYQYAINLDPEHPDIQQKLQLTQDIINGKGAPLPLTFGDHPQTPETLLQMHQKLNALEKRLHTELCESVQYMYMLDRMHDEFVRQNEHELSMFTAFHHALRDIAHLLTGQEHAMRALTCL